MNQPASPPSSRSVRTRIAVERDAVAVVVAVDDDPRATRDVTEDERGGLVQPRERARRMAVVGGEEGARLLRVGRPRRTSACATGALTPSSRSSSAHAPKGAAGISNRGSSTAGR